MDLQPVKVQAEVMWAFLDTPNELSGKYQVDLCKLSDEAVAKLREIGLNVRKKEDQPEKGGYRVKNDKAGGSSSQNVEEV